MKEGKATSRPPSATNNEGGGPDNKKRGRPSSYTPELGRKICKRIADGKTLRGICREKGMPKASTVVGWTIDHEAFYEQYARARQSQAEHLFDEILEIADDDTKDIGVDGEGDEKANRIALERARLKIDSRKWYLSKVLPKVYGEKLDLTSKGGKLADPDVTDEAYARIIARAREGVGSPTGSAA